MNELQIKITQRISKRNWGQAQPESKTTQVGSGERGENKSGGTPVHQGWFSPIYLSGARGWVTRLTVGSVGCCRARRQRTGRRQHSLEGSSSRTEAGSSFPEAAEALDGAGTLLDRWQATPDGGEATAGDGVAAAGLQWL
ncbi:unnamed protein product [Cuscuta europaea]|uniref:Uncharacterized protein n=1 Tax=Cuscuta europaea TaxID=41803 RepID=A0A9P0ZKD6_CUSEU|nr:unnamed protein product [Cuscuta europaea]